MRNRMLLSYAVPTILLLVILLAVSYPKLFGHYKEQLRHSVNQSLNQSVSFQEQFIQNMTYLAQIVEQNGAVQKIVTAEDFRKEDTYVKQYEEYFSLIESFSNIEYDNGTYQFNLFVPDVKYYSSYHYYFYEESILKQKHDYALFVQQLKSGRDVLAADEVVKSRLDTAPVEMLTLYHKIYPARVNPEDEQDIVICSVSVPLSIFREVMNHADITESGLVYLIDSEGDMIVNSNEELFQTIKDTKLFVSNGEEVSFEKISFDTNRYYMTRKNMGEDGWQVVALIPQEEYTGKYEVLVFQIVAVAAVIAIAIVIISTLLAGYYVGKLGRLRRKMYEIQEGKLNVRLAEGVHGDEIEDVYRAFDFMIGEVQQMIRKNYKLGKDVKMAELRALQAQINPHFLYNTLDIVSWMARDYAAPEIENIIWNLAKYYRLSLNKGSSIVTLAQEIEHIRVYVNIQNYHFDHAIHMDIDIPEQFHSLACLNIILQPFVENSIMHGIAEIPSMKECRISIYARQIGEELYLYIEDNGPGMTEEQMQKVVSFENPGTDKGYGIKNVNFRIKLSFGEKYGISYMPNEAGGTTVVVKLPMLSPEEARKL